MSFAIAFICCFGCLLEGILCVVASQNKPNFVFGVRTIDTIQKPDIWKKVNLAAGIVSFVTFVIQIYVIFTVVHETVLIFLSFADLFVPMIAGLLVAYILGYKEKKKDEEIEHEKYL